MIPLEAIMPTSPKHPTTQRSMKGASNGMISLHTLSPSQTRQKYKRVGRGNSSGKGTTAGRGTKGQRARTGGRNKLTRRGLKHLIERTPKTRGFLSRRTAMSVVTLSQLQQSFSDGQTISPNALVKAGLLAPSHRGVKIIGNTISKKLIIKASKFSSAAAAAITKAGGQAVMPEAQPSSNPT